MDNAAWILIIIALAWFLSIGLRFSLPVLLPHISTEFGLDVSIAGTLMALVFVGYGVGQIPGGALADQLGERNIFVVSMATLTLGAFILAVIESLAAMVVGIFLIGFGGGVFAPARFTILSDTYSDREGTAHGVAMAAGDVGNILMPVIAGFVAGAFFWRLGIGYTLPFLLIAIIGLAVIVPKRTSKPTDTKLFSRRLLRSLKRELSQKAVVVAVVLLLLQSVMFQGHTSLYPTYLVSEKGLTEEFASVLLGVFFVGSVVTHILAGGLRDRYGTRPINLLLLVIGAVAFAFIPMVDSVPAIVVLSFLSASFMGVITVTLPYLIGALSDEMQGTGFGVIRTGYILPAAASPILIGQFADIGMFNLGLYFLSGVAIVSLVVSLTLPK